MSLHDDIATVFAQVWRFDFDAPGFFDLDAGPEIDSHALGFRMITLKQWLSEFAQAALGKRFVYRSLNRFDQQVSTKFHLDGAPPESLLLLGYEPSKVRSRLFLADYSRSAFDLGITPQQFLSDYNPMFKKGDEALARYVTELPQPSPGHSRILLINNSCLPFTAARVNPLGVMHKAEIVHPDDSQHRIVNSIMLATAAASAAEDATIQEHDFIATDNISPKAYG